MFKKGMVNSKGILIGFWASGNEISPVELLLSDGVNRSEGRWVWLRVCLDTKEAVWKRVYHVFETDLKRRMCLVGTRVKMSIIASCGSSDIF